MVKPATAYICEKCGHYDFNKHKVMMHERKPITGVCDSLDGLVVSFDPTGRDISVFREADGYGVNLNHEKLYIWDNYVVGRNSIKTEDEASPLLSKLREKTQKVLDALGGGKGFTADKIKGTTLYGGHSENTYRHYHELSAREFGKVCRLLKEKFPELYSGIEFKRTIAIERKFKV